MPTRLCEKLRKVRRDRVSGVLAMRRPCSHTHRPATLGLRHVEAWMNKTSSQPRGRISGDRDGVKKPSPDRRPPTRAYSGFDRRQTDRSPAAGTIDRCRAGHDVNRFAVARISFSHTRRGLGNAGDPRSRKTYALRATDPAPVKTNCATVAGWIESDDGTPVSDKVPVMVATSHGGETALPGGGS